MSDDFGILSYGAYLPRLRLQRKSIARWDEDSITMAVEAARPSGQILPALAGFARLAVGSSPSLGLVEPLC
jgi:3-hydroxy-3-methylglutaryl CoA synthase